MVTWQHGNGPGTFLRVRWSLKQGVTLEHCSGSGNPGCHLLCYLYRTFVSTAPLEVSFNLCQIFKPSLLLSKHAKKNRNAQESKFSDYCKGEEWANKKISQSSDILRVKTTEF